MRYRDERIKDKADEFEPSKPYENLPIGSQEIIAKIKKLRSVQSAVMKKFDIDEDEDDDDENDLDFNEDDDEFNEDPATDMIYDSPLEDLEAGLYYKQTIEHLQTTNV